MATWTGTGSHNSTYIGTLTVTERMPTAADIANNQTTVDWSLMLENNNSTYFLSTTVTSAVIIGGITVLSQSVKSDMAPAAAAKYHSLAVASGTLVINHDADGSKTVSVSASIATATTKSYLPGTVAITGGSFALTTLPRASTMTVPAFVAGTAGTLTIARAANTFAHAIAYSFGASSGTVVSDTSSTTVSWTPPFSLLNEIPETESGTGNLRLTTFDGDTVVGFKDYPFTLTAPATVRPSCSFTFADITECFDEFGIFIQGYSALRIQTSATLAYGSPIRSVSVSVDEQVYAGADVTTNPLRTAMSDLPIIVTVTDARGRTSAPSEQTIDVAPYTPPVVTLAAGRCTSAGVPDEEGTNMQISFAANLSLTDYGNEAGWQIRYRKDGTETWTTLSGTGTSYESAVIPAAAASAYDIEITVVDLISETEKAKVVPIAYVLRDFHSSGRGIAIGKVATREGFDVAMPTYLPAETKIDERELWELVYPVGVVFSAYSSEGIDPQDLFGGEWEPVPGPTPDFDSWRRTS